MTDQEGKIPFIKLAPVFGVTRQTVSNWVSKGCPQDSIESVAKWADMHCVTKQQPLKDAIRKILYSDQPPPPKKKSQKTKRSQPKEELEHIKVPENEQEKASLESIRDYYVEELTKAQRVKNLGDIRYWNELLLKTEKCIREAEAHAKKLGIDRGEMLAREEVERIIRVMVYAGNACVAGVCKQMAGRLAAMEDPNEIYDFLRANVLGGRIFEGFSKVAKADGPTLLPEWFIKAMLNEKEVYLCQSK